MQSYFGLADQEAYHILRTSNTSAQAITRAMSYVPEAERKPRIIHVINDLGQSHPNVSSSPILVAFVNGSGGEESNGSGVNGAGRPSGNGPKRGGGGSGNNGYGGRPSDEAGETPGTRAFLAGLGQGWVVTRNSGGMIFVHRSDFGGVLSGLKYVIEESPDGSTWTIHAPRYTSSGTRYGRTVGVIEKPATVRVGSCTCE